VKVWIKKFVNSGRWKEGKMGSLQNKKKMKSLASSSQDAAGYRLDAGDGGNPKKNVIFGGGGKGSVH